MISSATNKVVASISVGSTFGSSHAFMTYDSLNKNVYVADEKGAVSIISSATNKVLTTISLGSDSYFPAFDPANNDVYVSNFISGTVSVVSSTTNKVISTITVGNHAFYMAYDPANKNMYVTTDSHTVVVINSASNKVVATIKVASSSFNGYLAFDASNKVYIT